MLTTSVGEHQDLPQRSVIQQCLAKMAQFDEVLDELGSFGHFQLRLFLVVSLFETPAAWAMFLPVFAAAKPTWRCPVQSPDLSNGIDWLNTTISTALNYTENTCTESNTVCAGIEYTSEFTSIVSEVGVSL